MFFYCLLSLPFYSQNNHYSVLNIAINDEKPHFSLSVNKNDEVLFTSWLLNKNGKVKAYLDEGILILDTGIKNQSGNIINVEELKIDKKEDIFNISSAVYSQDKKICLLQQII